MTDYTPPTDTDFDGCNRKCRAQQRHTMEYGRCEHADKPEPTVSMSKICTGPDGYPSIGYDQYTVPQLAELIEPALTKTAPGARREIPEMAAEAARAIVHRNDGPATPAALPSIHANDVEGFCPACGHGVLMLGDGGHVVCTLMDCPRPEAADELLRNVAVPSAPAGRADDDPRSIPVYTPGMAPGEEIAMLRRTLIAAEDSRVELRAECARLRDRLWKRDTDRAELRDRIAEALISWSYRGQEPDPEAGILETVRANAHSRADAVLAVLPPPVDRGAVLREAAEVVFALDFDELRATDSFDSHRQAWELGTIDAHNLLCRMADEAQQAEAHRCANCEGIDPDTCLMNPDRPADSRPRCPDCQMPHDLTPGVALACASIRASIADQGCVADEAQQQQPRRVKARVVAVTKSPALLDTPDDEIAALCAAEAQQQPADKEA